MQNALVRIQPVAMPVPRVDFEDGEPRIRDVDLGACLEMAQPREIRRLIERHSAALGRRVTVPRRPESGGHEVEEAWLTEHQAIYIIAKSETAIANDILQQVIDVFVKVRRGTIHAPIAKTSSTRATLLALLEHEDRLAALEETQANTDAKASQALAGVTEVRQLVAGLDVLVPKNDEPHMTAFEFCLKHGDPVGIGGLDNKVGSRASALLRREIKSTRRGKLTDVVLHSVDVTNGYGTGNTYPLRILADARNQVLTGVKLPKR